jgi:predicted ATPase
MKIESIRLKNFKAFQDVEMRDIPKLCVLVGANGTGKSSLFSVFGFLKDALSGNVNTALAKLGGARGFDEILSRGSSGSIEIELKFREKPAKDSKLITYFLQIGKNNGRAFVQREILKYRRGSGGKPWHFLDFQDGEGEAVTNELNVNVESDLERERQKLKSNDILAVKGLAQFERFSAAMALGNLIENWHISDFHISHARREQDAGYAEHLSRDGENLSLVVQYLYQNNKETFKKILSIMKKRVPGVADANAETDSEGKVLLRFKDGAFNDTFLARFVSDGTIKMLAYLVLLYDPSPFPLLCVEEPENQLYPSILAELVEEFRDYARRGGQVFVSTHSPDFLNAVELDEVFWLEKRNGYTQIKRAENNKQIAAYMKDGDKMGYLWKQGFFGGVDPK